MYVVQKLCVHLCIVYDTYSIIAKPPPSRSSPHLHLTNTCISYMKRHSKWSHTDCLWTFSVVKMKFKAKMVKKKTNTNKTTLKRFMTKSDRICRHPWLLLCTSTPPSTPQPPFAAHLLPIRLLNAFIVAQIQKSEFLKAIKRTQAHTHAHTIHKKKCYESARKACWFSSSNSRTRRFVLSSVGKVTFKVVTKSHISLLTQSNC